MRKLQELPRMDRTIVKRTTLDQQGRDSGVPNATPAERLMMVWPLTLAASPVQTSDKSWTVTIAGHPKDDLAPGTLNSILRQAGLKD